MGIATVNPSTGQLIRSYATLTPTEIEAAIATAAKTFSTYRQTDLATRSQWLQQVATILEVHKQEYAAMITLEMGKPLKAAIAEVEKSATVCRFYAEQGAEFLATTIVATDARQSWVQYQPLGVILAVMPWNFPFWQVFRFAAPALMAGNVGLLKHASNVPQTALAIAAIITEAGFPSGVFQTLLIGSEQVATVIADQRVQAATLTGSEAAGISLATHAAKVLKKVVLELGGSDPFIVMPSADLEQAVTTAVTARMLNNGQSCIAAKRFILAASIADQFIERFVQRCQQLTIGDPMQLDIDIGPLATPGILQDLDRQVQATVKAGATVLLGGQPLDRPGNFYPPTILTDIPKHSPGMDQEFFGPVALVFRVADIDAAIALANQTTFGLGASAWTTDTDEQIRFCHELEAGSVFINGMVKSDPRLPFGGIKRSGYGRELGRIGMHEFVNIKTIWIK
jgi:succinate-semialdehyde dehydrogenase / glutarate-semialdehyde dehydrogenase